jgi:alpha-ketoglutarate-dependent 2,4-dichlorophenoxyacetate dioxygenase
MDVSVDISVQTGTPDGQKGMTMALAIRPLHPTLAAEVSGVDLRQADKEIAAELVAANDRYSVLVFRDQDLDDESLVRFASLFGPLETVGGYAYPGEPRRVHNEISDISNVGLDGQARPRHDEHRLSSITNEMWHTDSSFKALAAKYSMLYAVTVPPTGHRTEFADMRAAYDSLDDKMKVRIDDLIAEHSTAFSTGIIGYTPKELPNATKPPVPQRLTRRLPGSGRQSLYVASHAGNIIGWPMPESRSLIFQLIDHATQPQFVYGHDWRARDLVWWDDRCTMHRARPNWEEIDDVRDMRRATVSDIAPTVEQPSALAAV